MRLADIGTVTSEARWREDGGLFERVLPAVIAGMFAAIAMQLVTSGQLRPLAWVDVGPIVAIGGLAYWMFLPARCATYFGELGVLRTRTQRFATETTGFLFHAAARVEMTYERIITDGVTQLYMHTNVFWVWRDDGGAQVFALSAVVREPSQIEDWTTTGAFDETAFDGLAVSHPATFAVAAKRAFQTYLEHGPYR